MPNDRPRPPRSQSSSGRPDRSERGPTRGRDGDDRRPVRGRDSDDRRPTRGRDSDDRRPARPALTAAEQKSREVYARTGGRRTEGTGAPTARPVRKKVEWVDEGAVKKTARKAVQRGAAPRSRSQGDNRGENRVPGIPRSDRPLPSDISRDVEKGVGVRQSQSTTERLQKAIDAFEYERYEDAARLLQVLSRQLPGMALVHEMAGLCAYRQAKWRTAVNELEATRVLDPSRTTVLPVLADAYRALRRWSKVNQIWTEIKDLSPHPSVLAEGRIVAAGALSDQGKLADAVRLFDSVLNVPKRVQDYHLRQWYMAADLHDRSGNIVEARRLFARVMQYDAEFVDVADRLSHLGPVR